MRRSALMLAAAALVLVAAACGGGETVSPLPENKVTITTQAIKGDPTAGEDLFKKNGCDGCHTFKPAGATAKVGPDLDNLAADAKKADRGTVEEYTTESIKDPGAYVTPGFSNAMPSFAQLNDKQVADLVAFLTKS